MKLSQYNVVLELEEGLLLVNLKNSSYVKITKEPELSSFKELLESKKLDKNDNMVQLLYQNGYIVDKNLDEYSEVNSKISQIVNELEESLNVTLYVTNQCNFRCIYCPEKHCSTRMSNEIWEAVYKYTEREVKAGKLKKLFFSFFGGEPLLETKRIISFLERIDALVKQYPDVEYFGDITTNGYMLTPKVYDRLTQLNVIQYQITVDGDRDSHNQMRPRVDGQGTWDKIVENLKYISQFDDKVQVIVRTNHNHINEPKLEEFYEWIKGVLSNKKFVFSLNPVGKLDEKTDDSLAADLESQEVQELRVEMEQKNKGRSIANKYNPLQIGASICPAQSKNMFIVASDGRIAKCNDIYIGSDEDYVGYLNKEGEIKYYKNLSRWYNDCEHSGCRKCPYYPICGARSCPAKKMESLFKRNDCIAMKKGFNAHVLNLIKEGLLL